jgi:hypothetical protein
MDGLHSLMRQRPLGVSSAIVSLDLQGELDPRFGQIERRIQRAGWVIIAIVLIAAIAGLFGGGFFSNTTTRHNSEGHEIALTYARFGRAESNLELELQVMAADAPAPELEVALSGEFLDKVSITGVSPEPESESVQGDAVVYTWEVDDWSRPLALRFNYESRDWRSIGGRFDVRAGDESLGSLPFEQFLFP